MSDRSLQTWSEHTVLLPRASEPTLSSRTVGSYLNTGKCISIAKRIGKTRKYWYDLAWIATISETHIWIAWIYGNSGNPIITNGKFK